MPLLYAGRKIFAGGAQMSAGSMRRAGKWIPTSRRRQPFTDLEEPIRIAGEDTDGETENAPSGESVEEAMSGSGTNGGSAATQGREAGPRIKFNRAKKSTAALVGAAAVAAGLVAAAGATVSEEEAVEEEEELEDDEEEEEIEESSTRELEIDEEAVTLRQDAEHDVPLPKVRAPKRRSKQDPRQEFYDTLKESAPDGSEDYQLPNLGLLSQSDDISYEDQLVEVRRKALILEATFKDFGFDIRVVEIETGPVIAQYEIELEAGLRLSKITGLADDLAIALRVPSVRIVAPIPGKNTVGIEVPNENRQVVRLRDVIEESDTKSAKMNIPVFLGKDVSGNPMVVDLAKMPHLLIAGRTGTGKSVCLNAIIVSILMCCRPDEVRMLMIDPKMVELSGYGKLPHLMHPVIVDMKKAEAILAWAVEKMEERYSLLAKAGVRHINSYNALGREELLRRMEIDEEDDPKEVPDKLPFIVIIADEMADLMMTAGKEVETHIIRIAQKSRAVGIHLILATQKTHGRCHHGIDQE